METLRIYRNRIGPGEHLTAVAGTDPIPQRVQTEPVADKADKVPGAAGELKTHDIRAKEPFQDLPSPGKLNVELSGRKGDMEEETDPHVGSLAAQHLRDELQVIVLNPHHSTFGCNLGHVVGKPLIDDDVGIPPLAAKLRRSDGIVIQRPERRIGEALVIVLDLRG